MSASVGGAASLLRDSHSSLLSAHSKYAETLISVCSKSPSGSHFASDLEGKLNFGCLLAQEIEDDKAFLELVKCIEMLEASNAALISRVGTLEQEKSELRDELDNVQRKLHNVQDQMISLEGEKQELEFLLQLKTSEHDELLNRLSSDGGPSDPLFDPEDLCAPFVKYSSSSNATFAYPSNKAKSSQKSQRTEPDDQSSSPPKDVRQTGNVTMGYDGLNQSGSSDIDLEELSDKLSWYESVMRQLQQILGAQLDDPDAGYHQESTKILERAKRMAEYKEMIVYYEGTVRDLRDENSRLEKHQQQLLRKAEERAHVPEKPRVLAQIPTNVPFRSNKITVLENRLSDPSIPLSKLPAQQAVTSRMQTKDKNVAVK